MTSERTDPDESIVDDTFRVERIDHVELFVPDRYEAAAWYNDVLGLEIVESLEHWAERSSYPLMVAGAGGETKLALFEGSPGTTTDPKGFHKVAFRVSGEDFISFVDRLAAVPSIDADGRESIVTFGTETAWSVSFSDPYGYEFEITTYDYEEVAEKL